MKINILDKPLAPLAFTLRVKLPTGGTPNRLFSVPSCSA